MVNSLLAKKIGMSQLISDSGEVLGVTWLDVTPNDIIQVKTLEKEGYNAVQLGIGQEKKLNKAKAGHVKDMLSKKLKEVKIEDSSSMKVGDKIDLSIFEVGKKVHVTAVSKGKGFAGTIKRHNFSRGPETHGHDHHRAPGSIGAMGMPRVHPGKKMAGHMGDEQITTKNLKIAAIDKSNNQIALAGSVPGANKGFVLISKNA
ncbi:MAG: 50S ribosomal protein L3 [Patescibacteria group bacterium]|nr:50S ribosomal protein L3 [Patescibacteria group bacterium]